MTPRPWLAPAAAVFAAAGAMRARLYARGLLRRHALDGPVISVGNLAVGGRGKSPLVAHIAAILPECGRKVSILSRGYGGTFDGRPLLVSDGETVLTTADVAGDEPVMLARSLPGVVVAVARDRLAAGRPMPAGVLRERASALARADVVLLSTRNGAPLPPGLNPARTLRWHRRSLGFFAMDGAPRRLPARAFILSAIAAPERLVDDLAALGSRVVGQALYRDHHRFTVAEVAAAAYAAGAAGADAVVTTDKDAVRIALVATGDGAPPIVVHRIESVFEDEPRLREMVLRVSRDA